MRARLAGAARGLNLTGHVRCCSRDSTKEVRLPLAASAALERSFSGQKNKAGELRETQWKKYFEDLRIRSLIQPLDQAQMVKVALAEYAEMLSSWSDRKVRRIRYMH